ncbi:MAG: GNAT family N-acetyltransferase [Thermoguttaceae bacterium]|nr:GNAT family N-acetyltransferase [Thermoguttaceae bacterium]
MIYRIMRSDEWNTVADLIYKSLNVWYLKNRGFELVQGAVASMLVFPREYESLDPGCCVVAEDETTGRLAGSSFFHVRPTHVALGILNVHPDFFGQKVASGLVRYIIDVAQKHQLPLRLVSSAMNLDSFNLYNRYGFVPTIFFQDMIVTVPDGGFSVKLPCGTSIRSATESDIAEMVALEEELYSINREKDFRFFLKNSSGIWHMSVLVNDVTGQIEGFTASVCDPGSHMIGPGIARTQEQMAALIAAELSRYPGQNFVWLIPSDCKTLSQAMYELGAKNCELHIGQVRGDFVPARGVVIPSFMPETS